MGILDQLIPNVLGFRQKENRSPSACFLALPRARARSGDSHRVGAQSPSRTRGLADCGSGLLINPPLAGLSFLDAARFISRRKCGQTELCVMPRRKVTDDQYDVRGLVARETS